MDPLNDPLYELYPRKISKPDAYVAMNKARKYLMKEELLTKLQAQERMMKGTARFRKEWDTLIEKKAKDKKYIPHPASWFNDHGFDEPPFARNPEAEALMKTESSDMPTFEQCLAKWPEIEAQFGIPWSDQRFWKKSWELTWNSLPVTVRNSLKELIA